MFFGLVFRLLEEGGCVCFLLSGDIPSQLVSVSFMSFDIVWRWVFESCLVELVLLLDSFSEFRITPLLSS